MSNSFSDEHSEFLWSKLPLCEKQVVFLRGKSLLEEKVLNRKDQFKLQESLKIIESEILKEVNEQRILGEKLRKEDLERKAGEGKKTTTQALPMKMQTSTPNLRKNTMKRQDSYRYFGEVGSPLKRRRKMY